MEKGRRIGTAEPGMGEDVTFEALTRTDRCCRLVLKRLRESIPTCWRGRSSRS